MRYPTLWVQCWSGSSLFLPSLCCIQSLVFQLHFALCIQSSAFEWIRKCCQKSSHIVNRSMRQVHKLAEKPFQMMSFASVPTAEFLNTWGDVLATAACFECFEISLFLSLLLYSDVRLLFFTLLQAFSEEFLLKVQTKDPPFFILLLLLLFLSS